MPLILIKTTQDSIKDYKIAKRITDLTVNELEVTVFDVAIKFENSKLCHVDVYLYDKKQHPSQKDRTAEVFEKLRTKIKDYIENMTKLKFTVELHLILKERCFRGRKPRF